MHPPTPIVAEKDLDLELSAVTAFTSGLLLQLAMRVTGIRADQSFGSVRGRVS